MRNFHLTRIAVNLLLIVAVAMQPVAVCLAGVDCSANCSDNTTFTCQGCGCCEVEHAEDRCCCCGGPAEAEVEEKAEGGCCSKHPASEQGEASEQAEASSEDVDERSASVIAPTEAGVRSICLCEQDSQPLSDSSPRRPTSEPRDSSLVFGARNLDEVCLNRDQLLAATQCAADVPARSHFAQVMLCIWRL